MPEFAARRRDVLRILERYIIEIIEEYELCPWAPRARLGGSIGIGILWGTPSLDAWTTCSAALLAQREVQVAMVVAPELLCSSAELRSVRDDVCAQLPHAGVAHFHPDAALDLSTPARLVPTLRRSPDPMLQLVPLRVLDAVRGRAAVAAGRSVQAQMLVDSVPPPKPALADQVAAVNYARALRDIDALTAKLADIRSDRDRTYATWNR